MSVARKTPKFADSLHSRTPLKQPGKSTSPSPSRYLQSSPFSNPPKGSRMSTRNSPHSKMTLKESVEALKQIRDYNESVIGSGNKLTGTTIYDKKEFESVSDFERDIGKRDSVPMRNHITKIEAFLASRKPKKEEKVVEPHNLAWRAASHDAQAKLLKEGTPSNQWPNTNLLGQMGELYDKYDNEQRIPKASSPAKENRAPVPTRRSTKMEDDMLRRDQERYSNKENHVSGRKSTKDGRFSHTTGSSNMSEAYKKSGPSEIEKLKIEANKTKNQMKGKIDFINSLYEELAMQPREKPIMPSNRSVSPAAIDSKETPRSLSLVDDSEIEASISNRRRSNKKEESGERNDQISENRRGYSEKQTTFGDDAGERGRLNSAQKIALRDIIAQEDSLARKVGGSNSKYVRCGENYQGMEGSTQVTEKRESPNENENDEEIGRGEDTERRRENNRPPLPGKRGQGDNESEWMNTRGSVFSREAKSTKNYIEMNKTSSGVKSKKYTSYEKVLRNVEELCKPLLETLKNVSKKNEAHLNPRCTSNKQGKWSPCSAVSSAQKEHRRKSHSIVSTPAVKEFAQTDSTINRPLDGLGDTRSSINGFYEEMNNLTLKITEAANVMQKTLDKLERYKAEDTERGDRSARTREGSPNGRRYGYNQINEDEIY